MAGQKKLHDFLTEFFQLAQLHDMFEFHAEQRAQFTDYIDKNDLTDNMGKWVKNFIKKDANGVPDKQHGEYSLVDEPTPDVISDKDWKKLFAICQSTLTGMKQSYSSLNPEAQYFVNYWSTLFIDESEHTDFVSTQATDQQIDLLYHLLTTDPSKTVLQTKLSQNGEWANILGTDRNKRISYTELLNGIRAKKYNKTADFQDIIYNLATQINKETDPNQNPKANEAINKLGGTRPNFDLIIGNGWSPYNVSSGKIDDFKSQYSPFLKDIFTQPKVIEAYKQFEGNNNQISTALENAISKTDYNNKESKDYITPKREDRLTPYQQLSKWCSDTYDDSLKKYFTLRGDRLFFKRQTAEIVKAITKCGIKPSDGLVKIVDETNNIKKNLGHSPQSKEAFDWMAKILQEFKDDPKMKKTLQGALKNGRQMRNLIQEIALTAITESIKKDGTMDDKTIQKVKIAMETLSAIRYSLVTSKIMEALRSQTFSMVSDGSLSWNKTEGMKFVANALDKTIGFAFRSATYIIPIGINTVRRRGSKFNGKMQHGKKDKTGKRYERAYNNWDTINTTKKNEAIQRKTDYENSIQAEEISQQNDANSAYNLLTNGRTFAPTMSKSEVVDALEQELNTTDLEAENQAFSVYGPMQDMLDNYEKMLDVADRILEIENDIAAIAPMPAPGTSEYVAKEKEIEELMKEKTELAKQLDTYAYIIPGLDVKLQTRKFQDVRDHINTAKTNLENDPNYILAKTTYESKCSGNDEKRNNIEQFRNASKRLKEISDTKKKNTDIVNSWDDKHKDYFHDLMNYWDMLDSGKVQMTNSAASDTKTVRFAHNFTPGAKSDKQKAIFRALENGYSLNY